MAYSSVSHGGWVVLISHRHSTWASYFAIYIATLWLLLSFLHSEFIKRIIQPLILKGILKRLTLMILVLSLAGIPPLVGFSVKWLSLTYLFQHLGWRLILLAVLFSFRLFYYVQMFIHSLLLNNKTQKGHNRLIEVLSLTLSLTLTPIIIVVLDVI
jgi:NADH:ubiquinone oxidoreductase subunit 2 (subunit N)